MSSNISFSHFFSSLVVGSFWQLRFEQGLKQTHYWLFRLTILKGRDVFSPSYICLLGSTGHWVGCWVCGLTLIFKVKICQSERTSNRNFVNQHLGKHKHRFIAKRSNLNLAPMAVCISQNLNQIYYKFTLFWIFLKQSSPHQKRQKLQIAFSTKAEDRHFPFSLSTHSIKFGRHWSQSLQMAKFTDLKISLAYSYIHVLYKRYCNTYVTGNMKI